ncbi:ABC transporter permease [Enterococcus sp. JM4C]|uniref:ABC transporter permease n=1 Tax=Candidatus Enterococcus huntleyi TaxID=1857217 RepID=UPI00137B5652|nr:ABC transporter permease [Enterococcus sp. JM4C]KAF1298122.1 ABC transporter permease [Enterococcus sp. JM4C]
MKNKPLFSFIIGLCSFFVLWTLLYFVVQNHSIPSPLATLQQAWIIKGQLLLHTGASFLRIFVALAISLIIGVPLGILLSRVSLIDDFLGPLLYFLYPLPKVAFLPVFMIFFGLGNTSKVLLIFAIISIQVIVSIRDGVNAIPQNYYRLLENYGSTTWQTTRYLILPAIRKTLFSSLRVSIGISLASLFFAENYNTTYGLGYLILSAWAKMNYPEMFVGILMIGILGFLLFRTLDYLEESKHSPK